MGNSYLGYGIFPLFFLFLLSLLFVFVHCQSRSSDASVMHALKQNLDPPRSLGWADPDPCNWNNVGCSADGRVIRIQIGHQGLTGSLPQSLSNQTMLQRLEVMYNHLTGSIPSLAGLNSLQFLLLSFNNFTSIPSDFFTGMTSLQAVYLDYNPFSAWEIPEILKSASTIQIFWQTARISPGKSPGKSPIFSGHSQVSPLFICPSITSRVAYLRAFRALQFSYCG